MQKESYEKEKISYIRKEKFEKTYLKDKKIRKARGDCHFTWKYRGATHSICTLKYSIPKQIPIAFHN